MHENDTLNQDELKDGKCLTCGNNCGGCAGCGLMCYKDGVPSPFGGFHTDDCPLNVCADCNGKWYQVMGMYDHSDTCPVFAERQADSQISVLDSFTVDMSGYQTASPQPALLTRSDGETLLYAGCLSTVYGSPNSGKSWIALLAARATIAAGGRCLWIDYEDNHKSLERRAAAIGFTEVSSKMFFRFARPELLYANEMHVSVAAQWIKQARGHGLVVLDSVTSAGCPSDGQDVTGWYETHVNPFKRREIAMLLIDHVAKRTADRGIGAIGSQHKLAILNGVGLSVKGVPWTGRQGGSITLTLEKDRHGQLPVGVGKKVAVINGEWIDGVLSLSVDSPTPSEAGVPLRDRVMDAIASVEDGIRGQTALRELGRVQA